MDFNTANNLLFTPIVHDDERDYYIYCEVGPVNVLDVLIFEPYITSSSPKNLTFTGLFYNNNYHPITILDDNGGVIHFIVNFLHMLYDEQENNTIWIGDRLLITPELDKEVMKMFGSGVTPVKVALSKPLLEFHLQMYSLRKLST